MTSRIILISNPICTACSQFHFISVIINTGKIPLVCADTAASIIAVVLPVSECPLSITICPIGIPGIEVTYNNNNNNNTNINSTNTNNNNNVSTSTNTNNNNNVSTSTNTNVNKNDSTSVATNNNNNVNVSTSTAVNKNENVNKSESTSQSSVKTDNTNTNINRNENITKSETTIKAPPASAIAPMISTYSQDVCVSGVSGAVTEAGIFNVNFDGWFDFRKKVDAVLTVNTIPIASGHIQVKKLYWQSGKLFEFEIVFFGEVPNLARLLNEKKLKDIESIVAGDLDYDLLHEYVETPPNEHTILTLCDKWNLTAYNPVGQPVYSTSVPIPPLYKPLYVGHLTPAVKAQYLFDQIISDAGLQYQSDYLGEILENVYVPFVNGQYLNSALGLNDIASNLGLASNLNNIPFANNDQYYDLYTQFTEYEDAGNDWSSGIYTAPFTGTFTFRCWVNGTATSTGGTNVGNVLFGFHPKVNDVFTLEDTFTYSLGTSTTNTLSSSGNITLELTQGDEVKFVFGAQPYTSGNGTMEIDFTGNANVDYTGTGVELVSTGTDLITKIKLSFPDQIVLLT